MLIYLHVHNLSQAGDMLRIRTTIKSYFIWKRGGGLKKHVYSTLHRHYGIAKLKITHFKCACAIP